MRYPLAALLLTAGRLAAQEQGAGDFRDGLERLAALGLPSMKGAEWVKAPSDLTIENFAQSYEFREIQVKLVGGAWRLPGEPKKLMGFGTPEQVAAEGEEEKKSGEPATPEEPGILERALRNYAASKEKENAGAPAPPPKPKADLAESDAKLITDALGKDTVRKELEQNMGYGRYALPGRLLLFSAQLHAAGKSDPAQKVAAAVFEVAPDKAAVVDAAISHLAELEYEKTANAFFANPDWVAYEKAVKVLLAKYPRGWGRSGAVALLTGPLEKRARGEKPPVPVLAGVELKPEAVAALEEMLSPSDASGISDEELAKANGIDLSEIPERNRARYIAMLREQARSGFRGGRRGGELWLLTKVEAGKDPASKLKALGMDGLIALAAVAKDETLIATPLNSGGSSYHEYFGSRRSPEEAAKEAYARMNRPSSRGEQAISLLAEVLPSRDEEAESDGAAMQTLAIEFWKAHRGKSAIELAAVYLAEGNGRQKNSAANFLATHAEPAAHALFEKEVLGSEDPVALSPLVETYLDVRKEAAKSFFEAYAKLLREALPDTGGDDEEQDPFESSSEAYQIKQAGGLEKYLKKLSMKVGGVPLKQLLDEALKAPPGEPGEDGESEDSPIAALSDSIVKLPRPEALTLVGEAAPRASTAQLAELYGIILNSLYNRRAVDRSGGGEVKLPPEVIALWKPLLERTEALPEKADYSDWTRRCGGRTMGDGALLLLEVCAFPQSGYSLQVFASTGRPQDLLPFVKTRVEAWSSGKEAPAWPSAEKVAEERKTEIEAKLGSLAKDQILPFTATLNIDEQLCVSELVMGYARNKEAPPGVVELNRTVVDLKSFDGGPPHDAELLEKLEVKQGWELDPAGFEKLATRMTEQAKELSGSAVCFYPAPMGLGVIATATRNIAPESRVLGGYFQALAGSFEEQGDPEGLVVLYMNGAEPDYWKLEGGKATKAGEPEAQRSALQVLGAARESKNIRPPYLQIIALSREDSGKYLQKP